MEGRICCLSAIAAIIGEAFSAVVDAYEKRTCKSFRPHHVGLAYQPPASSNFLSEQTTSNQSRVLFSQNKSASAISHQPNEQDG
jgi:hypothetical protein